MKKIFWLFLLFLSSNLFPQEKLIINTQSRSSLSLNGEWNYIVDPYENGFYNYRYEAFENFENPGKGAYFTNSKPESKSDLIEYNFDESDKINVPGDWNSQIENLFYYEGTVWYKKSFDYKKHKSSNRLFVYFGAVNYQAAVYLNGTKIGKHVGGFTPFNFEVTDLIKDSDNFLVVKVDNKRKREGVPTLNTDWWNYGGITREVKIIETSQDFIQDYFIQLDEKNKNQLKGYVKLIGKSIANKIISLTIPEINISVKLTTDKDGLANLYLPISSVQLWSPKNPKLYEIILKTDEDEIKDQIGFRSIKTDGKFILLNDEKIFLKGISIHEENPIRGGRAFSNEDALQLLTWAKELGCNYVRLAHYPHNENMIRLADEMGILVWEEIPVYWTIQWENDETYKNAEAQLKEIIKRDKNRACVIIWSMANETPTGEARTEFLTSLAKTARTLDPTRLISAALEQTNVNGNTYVRTIEDPFADVVDVLSFNQYVGWYDGLPEKCSQISWQIDQNKPVLISEFGGGAKFGFHADSLTRWSEEYQANLYSKTLKMISKIGQLQGVSPWILVDFRSPRRPLPKIQDGWNRKGLFSDKGEKKMAFYILKNFYDTK